MKGKTGKIILAILIILIILLLVLNAYATKKGYLNAYEWVKTLASDKNLEETEENANPAQTENNGNEPATVPEEATSKISNEEKYASIIKEYREAMKDTKYNESTGEKYKNVNTTLMHYYHSYNIMLGYAFYDIDNNGEDELLILEEVEKEQEITYSVIDMYGYTGEKPVKLIKDDTMGDRTKVTIFKNGVIYRNGSGGATSGVLIFDTIQENGYAMSRDTYYYKYDDSGKVSIYGDEAETNKLKYTSIEEVVKAYRKDSEKVSTNDLDFKVL